MFVSDFAKYIAAEEGFCKPSTVAWRNNNPGNLNIGPRAKGRDAAGHGLYDKISDGWADLEDLISGIIEKHPTLTLRTFFAGQRDSNSAVVAGGYPGYAPSADPRGANQPNAYASYMAAQMKIALDDPLVSFLPPTAYPNPPTVA